MKTSMLAGAALDWAVAIAEGIPAEEIKLPGWKGAGLCRYLRDKDGNLDGRYMTGPDLIFSRKWEAGGPIIEREGISVIRGNDRYTDEKVYEPEWAACIGQHSAEFTYGSQGDDYGRNYQIDGSATVGPTPLVAAMRCFVASRLGTEIEIPKGLA